MKLKKKLLAALIIIAMIIPTLIMPFSNVAYAAMGDSDKDIVFTGDGLTFVGDGTITVNVNVPQNSGIITVKLFDSNNQLCSIEDWTTDPTVVAAVVGTPYENRTIAGCSVPFSDPDNQSINGYYLEITSNVVNVGTLKFQFDNGDYDLVDGNNRIYLTDGDWNLLDFNATRDINEPKSISFNARDKSFVVDETNNIGTMNCPLTYMNGTLSFQVFNSDDTVAEMRPYIDFDAQNQAVPNGDGANVTLNSSSYAGSYMIVTATGTVDLSDIRFRFGDQYETIDPATGKVFFPDVEDYLSVADWNIEYVNERKEVSVRGTGVSVNGNIITLDSPMLFNTGKVKLAFYNSDDSAAICEPRYYWDDNLQQDVASTEEATVKLKNTSYLGSYMVVLEDTTNPIDITDVKFQFNNGVDGVPDANGKVYFPDQDWVDISDWNIQELNERKRLGIRGDNLTINNNSVTIDSPIEDNPGRLTLTFVNPDGSPAIIERRMEWDDQTQQNVPSQREAEVRFNSTVYEGVTVGVTSTSNPAVDLSDIKFEVPDGNGYLVPTNGSIVFPSMATWENSYISWDENSIKPLVDRKMININGTNISVSGNALTMDSPLEYNPGTITLEFYNSDNTPMKVEQYHRWNDQLGEDELDPTSAYAQLKTTSYAGAYFVVTSTSNPQVDLTDIKFRFNGDEFLIDAQTGKVELTAALDNSWVSIGDYNIEEVQTRKRIEFYDDNITFNNDGTVTIDCNASNNQGRLTFAVYDANDQLLNMHQDIIWDDQQQMDVPGPWVEGKFNSTTFDGTYLIVTSDGQVDLTKILVILDGQELTVGDEGRIDIPADIDANVLHIDPRSIRSTSKVSVKVTADAIDGDMVEFDVNDTPFIERDPADPPHVVSFCDTKDIEERENDTFTICVDYGYVIKKLTVNDTVIFDNGTTAWYEGEIPHASEYSVIVECDTDWSILPQVRWTYGNEEIYGLGAVVYHGTVEVVSVTLPDGQTTYDADEISLVDDPGFGMHYRHADEATLEEIYNQGQYVGTEMSALTGSTVRIRIVPEYGYQVTNLQTCGVTLVPTDDPAEYTFTMPMMNMTLSGLITAAGNTVKTETNKVQSGTIAVPQNEIDAGTAQLVVKDVDNATFNPAGFAIAAGDGYEIKTCFKLEMNNVCYKGTANSVWSESIASFNNPVTVSLKLAQGITENEIVIVHKALNSANYDVIKVDSYNSATNTITFKTKTFDDFAILAKNFVMPFADVSAGAWYYNAVKYVYENNIVKGYNDTTFAPEDKLTRGMMVTLLYRMEGSPNNNGVSRFTDVDSNMWYAKAIKWAVDNGIVHGYDGTTKFGPNDNIIRQDLAGILRNYARYKGKNVNVAADLGRFKDYQKVDSYANASMQWAVGKGVITGNDDGTLNPKGNATRAEAAAMLQKYCNKVGR